MLISLGVKFLPGLLGGIFGRKQQGPPDWFQKYLDDYKTNAVGGWDSLIQNEQNPGPVYKGLKQEALAAMGQGKYASQGYGPLSATALAALAAHQASQGKAIDRSTRMNFAASGVNSGLLPQVLAQQANEREQGNEIANADVMGKISLGAVTNFQSERRARQEYEAQLQQGKSSAYGNLLQAAAAGGKLPQSPGLLSQIFTGLSSAAPGILSGLDKSNPDTLAKGVLSGAPDFGGESMTMDSLTKAAQQTPSSSQANSLPMSVLTPPTMPNINPLNIPTSSVAQVTPGGLAPPSVGTGSVAPAQFSDWWKKYGAKQQRARF